MRSATPLAARLASGRRSAVGGRLARCPPLCVAGPAPLRLPCLPCLSCVPCARLSSRSASAGAFEARQQAAFPVNRTGVNSSGLKVERPVSPHVTIYSQPIPAVSSIANRVSGVLLTVGMYGGGLAALAGSCDLPGAIFAFQSSAPAVVPLVKAAVAWPLVYHTLAGVRHLYWDYTARGMDLASVELSSKALIASSVVLAVGAAFVTIQPQPLPPGKH